MIPLGHKPNKGEKMAKQFADIWGDVEQELHEARGISFDGCHKIYVLMDDRQVEQSAEWGYGEDGSFLVTDLTPEEMFVVVKGWYEGSCALRFVQSVATNEEDPNEGYNSIIPQGYESEFCVSCDNFGTDFGDLCSDCYEEDEEDEEEE
jgi:hypothetical protein